MGLDHTPWSDSSPGPRLSQKLAPGLSWQPREPLFSRCTETGLCERLRLEQVSSILTWLHWELLGNL